MTHAVFVQRSGILGVAVAASCGVITADQLLGLADLSKRITLHGIKMTTRQTMVFLINQEDLDLFRQEIEKTGLRMGVFGNIVRNVKGCPGNDQLCPRSAGDPFGLAVRIQERFMNQPTPKDFKISTAGCVRGCTDPYCADFGVVACGPGVYHVYLGGRGGSKDPRHGQLIASQQSENNVIALLEHVLNTYRELGMEDERLCRVIDRCGLEPFLAGVAAEECAAAAEDDFLAFLNQ